METKLDPVTKSINRYINKIKARHQKELAEEKLRVQYLISRTNEISRNQNYYRYLLDCIEEAVFPRLPREELSVILSSQIESFFTLYPHRSGEANPNDSNLPTFKEYLANHFRK